jgi:hypothetical protein
VIAAVKIDPVHRAFGERNFASGVTGKRDAGDQGMLEALANGGVGAVTKTFGEIFFEGRGVGRRRGAA